MNKVQEVIYYFDYITYGVLFAILDTDTKNDVIVAYKNDKRQLRVIKAISDNNDKLKVLYTIKDGLLYIVELYVKKKIIIPDEIILKILK